MVVMGGVGFAGGGFLQAALKCAFDLHLNAAWQRCGTCKEKPQEENMSSDFILEGIGHVDISTVEKFRALK